MGEAVIDHGPYQREQFAERVAAIQPHVAAILSICPETWCHTLTECWACGLPVFALDIGAVGERIRDPGGGWLVERDSAPSALRARFPAPPAPPGARPPPHEPPPPPPPAAGPP